MKVIITGASRGIGRGIALVLGRGGFPAGLLARNVEQLAEVRDEIQQGGGTCFVQPCDLRDAEAVEASIHSLIKQLNGVDALVNNAGVVLMKDAFTLSVDEWRLMIETNVNGLFYATRAVLPAMRERQHGHIVNVSSISGRLPLQGGSGYAASKHAVTGFSQSLFQEVRDFGIKVTTVYPGSVVTESRPTADDSWKVSPEEVGTAVLNLLRTGPGACISEIEIRPLKRPPGK